MTIFSVGDADATHVSIEAAVSALTSGKIVAVPTDSVYGLVADVSYTGAADKLFGLKKRSRSNEIPVVVADIEQALSISIGVPQIAIALMEKFWPGPLTLIVPREPDFVADLGSDDETIGLRCPSHVVPRLLGDEIGPLAITSAAVRDSELLTTATAVESAFGNSVPVVLDGGVCNAPLASIVDVTGEDPKLLREGAIAWHGIRAVCSSAPSGD